jgi:hypothetical protein
MRQLTKLVWPFPQSVIHTNPSGGGTYVAHSVVEQRLLDVLGCVETSVVQIIRGDVPGKAPDPDGKSQRAKTGTPDLKEAVVGVVLRMTAAIDGESVVVEEVGDCESPMNWPHDGARMKDAMSDAYKRCAMRLGCGLHLWAGDDFYLAEKFKRQDDELAPEPTPAAPSARVPAGVDPKTGEVKVPPGPVADDLEQMTAAQQKKIFASLKERDIEDRLDRLAWASATLGREVGSFNDLTRADAKTLIDQLSALEKVEAQT